MNQTLPPNHSQIFSKLRMSFKKQSSNQGVAVTSDDDTQALPSYAPVTDDSQLASDQNLPQSLNTAPNTLVPILASDDNTVATQSDQSIEPAESTDEPEGPSLEVAEATDEQESQLSDLSDTAEELTADPGSISQDALDPEVQDIVTLDETSQTADVAQENTSGLDTDLSLAVLETVLDEVEQQQSAYQAQTGSSQKELSASRSNAAEMSADVAAYVQQVESEPSPELSPEVEEYLQEVKEQNVELPAEVVLADEPPPASTVSYPSKPVLVLPITPEEEKEGAKKSVQWSFRWLVEWSRRIVKMFTGKIIYRQE